MTLTQLEQRVATIEKKLAHLVENIESPPAPGMNGWIDQIHGTFANDATYRKAASLGRKWRKSQSSSVKSRSPKSTAK